MFIQSDCTVFYYKRPHIPIGYPPVMPQLEMEKYHKTFGCSLWHYYVRKKICLHNLTQLDIWFGQNSQDGLEGCMDHISFPKNFV